MKLIKLNTGYFIFLAVLVLINATGTTTNGQGVGANRGNNASAGGRRSIKGKIYLTGESARIRTFKITSITRTWGR